MWSPRAGKVVGLNEGRACTVNNYQYVGEPWEARLLYRTQQYLEVREPTTAPKRSEEFVALVAAYAEGAGPHIETAVCCLALKKTEVGSRVPVVDSKRCRWCRWWRFEPFLRRALHNGTNVSRKSRRKGRDLVV